MENKDLKNWYKSSFEALESDAPDTSWESIRTELHPDAEATQVLRLEPQRRKRSLRLWLFASAACVTIAVVAFAVLNSPDASSFNYNQQVSSILTGEYQSRSTQAGADVFHLPDGSTVFLNEGSEISWSHDFGNTRSVVLSGEAFFDIVRDPANPFKVYNRGTVTEVLGTSFNISDQSDATVSIEVLSGQVQFSSETEQPVSARLSRGEVASWIAGQNAISKSVTQVAEGEHWFENQALLRNTELYREEAARSELYVSLDSWWQKNAKNETVISGVIENSATLLQFAEVELKATYVDQNGVKVASKFFKLAGPFEPGASQTFEQKMTDWVDGTVEIEVSITDLIPAD